MNLFVSLKYLVALDDHRHFGRAALACSVTQPALSNALRALEAHFGTSIVKRGRNFAGFTEEGERILVTGRAMLREYELLQQDLHSRIGRPMGHLVIGAVPTAVPIAARFAARLQARHPGIVPAVRSMSSVELETGLDSLSLDMGLGYAERVDEGSPSVRRLPQYTEHYFLLRRARAPAQRLQIGPPTRWADAARLPLCLLSPEMHNRTIVDRAFVAAGAQPKPAIETNSILALALSVGAGEVCTVMPGALVAAVQGEGGLEALPLVEPVIEVPIAFLVHETRQPSRTLVAATSLAESADWLAEARSHSGLLS